MCGGGTGPPPHIHVIDVRNTDDFTLGGLDFAENILEYARWSAGLVIRF